MGYVEARRLTPADRLEVCDQCNQQGLYTSGKEVKDSYGEVMLWLCFNCKQNNQEINV